MCNIIWHPYVGCLQVSFALCKSVAASRTVCELELGHSCDSREEQAPFSWQVTESRLYQPHLLQEKTHTHESLSSHSAKDEETVGLNKNFSTHCRRPTLAWGYLPSPPSKLQRCSRGSERWHRFGARDARPTNTIPVQSLCKFP